MKADSRLSRAWWPVALYACVILAATSIPGDRLALVSDIENVDRWLHVLLYVPLAVLVFGALRRTRPHLPLAYYGITTVLLCSAFGVLDELHQRFVPGRSCDVWDMIADAVGSALGTAASMALIYIQQRAGHGGRRAARGGEQGDS
ncbi:MAG: VanZ family protein [candidate division WS1 bacterium]|nr:VanZ family protein [candidate division WS1 bacterium]